MSVQLRGFLKNLIRCRTTFNFVVLAAFALVGAGQIFGPASVITDQSDYPPGSTVQISGTGFTPGENCPAPGVLRIVGRLPVGLVTVSGAATLKP